MSSDVRKLFASARASRRVSSPYASYSLAGALFCNACNNQPIKSETLWDAHIALSSHKANAAKKLPKKRPAEEEIRTEKKLKVSRKDGINVSLPVGFFDDDGEEEVIEEKEEKVETAEAPKAVLPDDFFAKESSTTNLDDEWEAFQADIAKEPSKSPPPPTASTLPIAVSSSTYTITAAPISAAELMAEKEVTRPEDIILGDIEDAQDAMADFFEEQSTLEQKVARLKQQREELRVKAAQGAGMEDATRKMSIVQEDNDDDDDDEEDYEDDLDMWTR